MDGSKCKSHNNQQSSSHSKDAKIFPKNTGSKLKEKWLLTRKTWRYMSDAGKKLFPDGIGNQKADIPKLEENFQQVCDNSEEYILWHRNYGRSVSLNDKTKSSRRPYEKYRHRRGLSRFGSKDEGNNSDMISTKDLSGWSLPADIYNHLIYNLGTTKFYNLSSSLLGEEIPEEDELEYEDNGDYLEIHDKLMRTIGIQTDPYLDMCTQTDEDTVARDYVNVGAETREETEAIVAYERSLMKKLASESKASTGDDKKNTVSGIKKQSLQCSLLQPNLENQVSNQAMATVSTDILSKNKNKVRNQSLRTTTQQVEEQPQIPSQYSQPPVLRKFWARRESITAKTEGQQNVSHIQENIGKIKFDEVDKNEKLANVSGAKTIALKPSTGSSQSHSPPKLDSPKYFDKKQNVFKMGLRCDMVTAKTSSKIRDKQLVDMFKTVNYDKTIRNIKSKWVPNAEEEEFIRFLQMQNEIDRQKIERGYKGKDKVWSKETQDHMDEGEKLKEKKKLKSRSIQVGDPLPQFILSGFRINSPVQIFHATRRKIYDFSSKTNSRSGSEGSLCHSEPKISPVKFSICILDSNEYRDLIVSESNVFKLTQMGIPFIYKKCSIESDDLDGEEHLKDCSTDDIHPQTISAVHASGYISQMLYNLRNGRFSNPFPGASSHAGTPLKCGDKTQRFTQNILKNFLSSVMQKSHLTNSRQVSHLISKKLWRARSKSQSHVSAGATSIWSPIVSTSFFYTKTFYFDMRMNELIQ